MEREGKKVMLSDIERKVEMLPFFNPEKKFKVNFSMYLTVIREEIGELKELIRFFRRDTIEFIKDVGDTTNEEGLVNLFRRKCFDGEGNNEAS